MKPFTLDEAAEQLGISREAVRKRMQRGTLPHTKTSDGRLHVYLDDEIAATEPAPSDERNLRSFSSPRRLLLDVIVPVLGSVAGLVAAVAALMYGLGLLALWISIYRTNTHDFGTAWYAASLVPNTVVAGLGVGQVLAPPTLAIVGTIGIYVLLVGAAVAFTRTGQHGIALIRLVRLVPWISPLFIFLLVYVATHRLLVSLLLSLGSLLCYSVVWHYAMRAMEEFLVSTGDSRETDTTNGREIGSYFWRPEYWFVVFFITNIALILGAAILATLFVEPPLPTVEITATGETRGTLLAHTDGFWYVFDQDGELISIPDAQVEVVRITSQDE